jgi:uncharacterized protein (DUF2384 family)
MMAYTKETLNELAKKVFGDKNKSEIWLNTPIKALHDQTPRSRLECEQGIEEVIAILQKIESGEFT